MCRSEKEIIFEIIWKPILIKYKTLSTTQTMDMGPCNREFLENVYSFVSKRHWVREYVHEFWNLYIVELPSWSHTCFP